MRIAVLLALLTAAVSAQTVTNLRVVEKGSSAISLEFDAAGLSSSAIRLEVGPTTSGGTYELPFSSQADGHKWIKNSSLAEGAKSYLRLFVDAVEVLCSAVCTNCGSGDDAEFADGSGLDCDGIGEPPNVTTAARPGDITPSAPAHATADPWVLCDSPTSTTQTNAAGLAALLTTKVGEAGTHLVKVSTAAPVLAVAHTFPALTTATRICIQPDVADELLVTDGATMPADESNTLNFFSSDPPQNEKLSGTGSVFFTGQSGYTFRQVRIQYTDNGRPYNPTQMTVTAVNAGARQLTLSGACPTGLSAFSEVWLNLPGMTYPAHAGVASCSSSVLTLSSGTISGTLSGNGTATWGSNLPISGATNATPTEITTAAAHGLPCDGTPTGQDFLWVNNVSNVPAGMYHYTCTGATTFTLQLPDGGGNVAATGAYVASEFDFARLNSGMRPELVSIASKTGFQCLHCILGDPWYGQHSARIVVNAQFAQDTAILGGRIYSGNIGCPVDPDTGGLPDCGQHSPYETSILRADSAQDLRFSDNVVLDAAGININFQSNSPGVVPSADISIERNAIYASDRAYHNSVTGYFQGSYEHYGANRHHIESKPGFTRARIEGNYLHGNAATANTLQPQGYAILIANTPFGDGLATAVATKSLEIGWNWIEDVGSCFAMARQTHTGAQNKTYHSRVWIHDNFCEQNWVDRRTIPSSPTSLDPAAGFHGNIFNLAEAGELFRVNNNTVWNTTGSGPCFLVLQNTGSIGLRYEDNILPYHGGVGEGVCAGGTTMTPVTTTTYQTRFDSHAGATGVFRNLMIPGVEDGLAVSANKSSTLDADVITDAEAAAAIATSGTWAGTTLVTGASFAIRHALVFPGGATAPDAAYSSWGVSSMETMRDKLGQTRNLAESSVGASSITLSWHAPTTAACTVRYTSDGWTTAAVTAAAGGTQAQSVALSGLTGTVQGRVECPEGKPLIWPGRVF